MHWSRMPQDARRIRKGVYGFLALLWLSSFCLHLEIVTTSSRALLHWKSPMAIQKHMTMCLNWFVVLKAYRNLGQTQYICSVSATSILFSNSLPSLRAPVAHFHFWQQKNIYLYWESLWGVLSLPATESLALSNFYVISCFHILLSDKQIRQTNLLWM